MPPIEITQFTGSFGNFHELTVDVRQSIYDIVKNRNVIISHEMLPTGNFVLYARCDDWEEDDELIEIYTTKNLFLHKLEKIINKIETFFK